MSRLWFFAAAFGGGMLVAFQAVLNNRLRQGLGGDALPVAVLSFMVGLLCLSIAVCLRGTAPSSARAVVDALPAIPWWALAGGACGAGYVLSIIVGVPRIGVAWCMAGVLLGQQVGALGMDHFGVAGLGRIPIDGARLTGLGLLTAGAWLLRPN